MHLHRSAFWAATALAALVAAAPFAQAAQTAATNGTTVAVIALPDWHPDITRDNALSAEALLGMDVYGAGGEDIGEVENIILAADGRVLSLVAEVGGLWDIGDTHTNIPWDKVKIDAATKRITLPITEDTIGDYSYLKDDVVTSLSAANRTGEVSGDGAGQVQTGPAAWRVTDLIGDTVALKAGAGYENYGSVDDVVMQNGKVSAVVVRPGYGMGANGLYAVPYTGYGAAWNPTLTSYNLPYSKAEVVALKPMDNDLFDMED